MKVIDPGHIYELDQLGGGTQRLTFVKRSGGAIQYSEEYAGVQVQEVLRALIDRTKYLYSVLPCIETKESISSLRRTILLFELRAYRRKQQKLNRKGPQHEEVGDLPFDESEIELRPVGEDGHIIIE